MPTVFIIHAADDAALSREIEQTLRRFGVAESAKSLNTSTTEANADSDVIALRDVETSDCVVVIWSQPLARSPRAGLAMRLAMHAWTLDRLALARPDQEPLPPGLRDLGASRIRKDIMLESVGTSSRQQDVDFLVRMIRDRLQGRARSTGPVVLASAAPAVAVPGPATGDRARLPPPPPPPASAKRSAGLLAPLLAIGLVCAAGAWNMWTLSLFRTSNEEILGVKPNQPPFGQANLLFETTVLVLGVALTAAITWLVWALMRRRRKSASEASLYATGPKVETAPHVTINSPAVPLEANQSGDAGPDVFISYSRQDADRVGAVVKQIEAAGYRVWIDTSETAGAQRYAGQIVRAIRASKVVALMCSQHAFQSDHVVREVYVAGDEKKSFVAVQLDDTAFPDDLVYFLSGFPRLAAAQLSQERLRTEIARFVVA